MLDDRRACAEYMYTTEAPIMNAFDAPFRINSPVVAAQFSREAAEFAPGGPGGEPPPPPPPPGDAYFARLVKLVPSEVVALYLCFKESAATWLGIWAAICLVLVFIVRTLGTRRAGKPIQWPGVGISVVSYILWIYATGGQILDFQLPTSTPGIISAAIGVWTFLIPIFYQGD